MAQPSYTITGQVPSIGRIVLYTAMDGNGLCVHLPAVITSLVEDDFVNLYVFPDADRDVIGGPKRRVGFGGALVPQTWYWPPRAG